jgi:predicted nucleotidyltransferase
MLNVEYSLRRLLFEAMANKFDPPIKPSANSRRRGITMPAIRDYARKIVDQFKPEQVILFGSYATGSAGDDSDVDLMVIMSCRNELDMAVKITMAVPAPFPLDLLVRKPNEWLWRTREGESFSREIQENGKVLYAQSDERVGEKSRVRSPRRLRARS